MFSKIVVPYDHSPLSKKALETAIMLAKQDKGIELDVITVVPANIPTTYYDALNVDEHREAQLKAAKKIVDELNAKLKVLANESKTIVLDGNPAEVILDFVDKNGVDLIVMGSRGLSGLKELFLGSVSHHVVQKAPCPVFIMK